jgi:multiple sugar transport system permease protein/raffinose/stachyose/melibiose transport system permease protein
LRRTPLLLFLVLYTIVSGGPFLWVMSMSLRTTPEIFDDPYACRSGCTGRSSPTPGPTSNYGTYFWNSLIVVVTAVALVTLIGAMAAHCLARYRFRGSRLCASSSSAA